jgi:hypothetical protein
MSIYLLTKWMQAVLGMLVPKMLVLASIFKPSDPRAEQFLILTGFILVFMFGQFLNLYAYASTHDVKIAQYIAKSAILTVAVATTSAFSTFTSASIGDALGAWFGLALGAAAGGIVAASGTAVLTVVSAMPIRQTRRSGWIVTGIGVIGTVVQIMVTILWPQQPW